MKEGRVLVVDDEPMVRDTLGQVLSDEGYVVDLAVDGESALVCIHAMRPDAILLDLMMPGIGGLAVLKEIRAASPNAATPVIVVSTVSDPAMIEQCISAGASAYHTKPVRRAELIATVKAQLAARGKPKSHAK